MNDAELIRRHWGHRIDEQLTLVGMSRDQLAEKLPCDKTTVRKWCLGERAPKPAMCVRIADVLHTTPAMLFTWPERVGARRP